MHPPMNLYSSMNGPAIQPKRRQHKPTIRATTDVRAQVPNPKIFAVLNSQKCGQNLRGQTYTLEIARSHYVDTDRISANHKLCIL